MRCKYRTILSIDGGGIRGVIPLTILSYIENKFKGIDDEIDLPGWVDVFSGTSTGAIITGALMITDEDNKRIFSSDEILNLYKYRGEQIFNKDTVAVNSKPDNALKLVLENNFGNIVINDITKHFLFASFDLNSNTPFIFTDRMNSYRNVPLSKVMMACSAIPGYLPPVKFGDLELADGILTAKNPSKLALEYARLFYPEDPIVLISLGTGRMPDSHNDAIEKEMNRTHLELEAESNRDDKLIYFRMQPELVEASPNMDDTNTSNINALMNDANKYIESNQQQLNRLFRLMEIRAELPL